MKKWRAVLVGLGIVVTAGCATHKPAQHGDSLAPLPDEPVTLSVTNHNWLDVVIYVVNPAERIRVFTVTAAASGEIEVPPRALRHSGQIRLLVHAVGNPKTFTSETIVAKPGSTIEWTIESELRRSSLAVW